MTYTIKPEQQPGSNLNKPLKKGLLRRFAEKLIALANFIVSLIPDKNDKNAPPVPLPARMSLQALALSLYFIAAVLLNINKWVESFRFKKQLPQHTKITRRPSSTAVTFKMLALVVSNLHQSISRSLSNKSIAKKSVSSQKRRRRCLRGNGCGGITTTTNSSPIKRQFSTPR